MFRPAPPSTVSFPGPCGDQVVAALAVDHVVAGAAEQDVVAVPAHDVVVARARVHEVIAVVRLDHVVATAAPQPLVAVDGHQVVHAVAAVQDHAPHDHVVPRVAPHRVRGVGVQHVVAGAAADGGDRRVAGGDLVVAVAEEDVDPVRPGALGGQFADDVGLVPGGEVRAVVAGLEGDRVPEADPPDSVAPVHGHHMEVVHLSRARGEGDRLLLPVGADAGLRPGAGAGCRWGRRLPGKRRGRWRAGPRRPRGR